MTTSSEVSSLLNSLESVDRHLFQDTEVERIRALKSARALCARLEKPWDAVIRMLYLDPSVAKAPLNVVLKVAIDLDLFRLIETHGPQTNSQLAAFTGADPILLARILRLLAAREILIETPPDAYGTSDLSAAFAAQIELGSGITHLFDVLLPAYASVPEFLRRTGYQNPSDSCRGPWQLASRTEGVRYFQWLAAHPREATSFNELMAGYTADRLSWLHIYPTAQLLDTAAVADVLKGDNEEAVLLVDVGGGLGHDLESFRRAHPNPSGRLVLQDLPDVIRQAETSGLHPSITPMPYDFLTSPQPVLGARAYYLHSVLHNWPDEQARLILMNLRSALRSGYSRILINDHVVTARGTNPLTASADMVMMAVLASQERTENVWRKLLNDVGLRIVRVWGAPEVVESVIEVALSGDGDDDELDV